MESDRLNWSASAKLRECYSEVEHDDEERKDIVQQMLQKSTDFLRQIIVPLKGQGGGHIVVCVPLLSSVSVGRLHLVGLVRARRPQQEEK